MKLENIHKKKKFKYQNKTAELVDINQKPEYSTH